MLRKSVSKQGVTREPSGGRSRSGIGDWPSPDASRRNWEQNVRKNKALDLSCKEDATSLHCAAAVIPLLLCEIASGDPKNWELIRRFKNFVRRNRHWL